jgi:hypothetical protein
MSLRRYRAAKRSVAAIGLHVIVAGGQQCASRQRCHARAVADNFRVGNAHVALGPIERMPKALLIDPVLATNTPIGA